MIRSKAFPIDLRICFTLLGFTLLGFLSVSVGSAQEQQPNPLDALTVENLIGEAVSLSNQKYPEIEKAIQRFKNNDMASTHDFLKNAVKKYPKLPPAQVIYARMNLLIRNRQAQQVGMFWLDKAAAEVPNDPEAYLILADQAFANQRTTEAQALFEYVAPLVEKYEGNTKRKQKFEIRVLAGRTAVAQKRSQWKEARKWLQQWVKIAPESAVAHQRLGTVLFNLKQPEEALAEFTKARKLDLDNRVLHPHVTLAQLYSAVSNVEEARKAFEHAYNEDKADEKTAQAFVNWLVIQDELKQAQAITKDLRKQKPANQVVLMLDGILDVMQGKHKAAISTMTEILSLDPSNSRATDLLALLLIESEKAGDQQKALRYAQVNAQRFTNNPQVNVTQGWVLFRLGRQNEAQQYINKVQSQKNSLSQDSLFLLTRMMVERGDKNKAKSMLEALLNSKSAQLFIFRRDAEKLLADMNAG